MPRVGQFAPDYLGQFPQDYLGQFHRNLQPYLFHICLSIPLPQSLFVYLFDQTPTYR